MMMQLQNLSVTFGKGTPLERSVLANCSANLEKGEFVALIGGNGAGKSTLFQVIAGTLSLDAGELILDGQNITKASPKSRSKDIAYVLQDPRLGTIGSMSIEENLSYAYLRGLPRLFSLHSQSKRREYFKQRLSELGLNLENRLNDLVGNLSGGQRQALSLVMATLRPCKVLLLDEITAALDPKMADLVLNLTIKMVREHKWTTLMITHNKSHLQGHVDRVLQLKDGLLQ